MRQRPWLVLVVGFGGLLLLMAAAETGALLFLNNLRHSGTELQSHFLARNRTLEQIRADIYLSGTFARDSLLAPEVSGARAQIAALEGLHRETEAALERYAQSLEPEESKPFQALRSEIEAYWRVLGRTFAWTAEERSKERFAFFYEELIPRRTSMLQIADRIAGLNEESLKRGDEKLGALLGRLQLGLELMIAVTLVGGAALAALTIFHILRLEGEVERRLKESVQAQASLQELSAKLLATGARRWIWRRTTSPTWWLWITMPNMNGIEATRRITEKHPRMGVVILSMHHDESYVIRSLKAGARAYLLKDAMQAELIAAIHAVAEGRSFFSPKISRILQEDYVHALGRKGADDSYLLLTDREREILQLVAEGKTNKEIANTLGLSLYTVDTHRTHILQKLNLHGVPEVILYAVRKGIIS